MRHRRSVRLPGFDYRTAGAYFVTVCAREKGPVFGHVEEGRMRLTPLGRIVVEEWHRTAALRPYVALDAFVVMPDHVHGIVWITEADVVDGGRDLDVRDDRGGDSDARRDVPRHVPTPPRARSLSHIINAFKGAVTRRARRDGLITDGIWQGRFYEHVIRDQRTLDDIRRYIAENPMRWHLRRCP